MYFTSRNPAADRLKFCVLDQNEFRYLNKIHLPLEGHHLLCPLENGIAGKSKWFPVDQSVIGWSREECSSQIENHLSRLWMLPLLLTLCLTPFVEAGC